MSGIKVFAPASVGNAIVGFDILGLCLERPGDEIIARKSATAGLKITKITQSAVAKLGTNGTTKLPTDPTKNTAGVAAQALLNHLGRPDEGIELEIHKKMPFGSGLGSSAASAVGATFAVSELLRTGLSKRELLPFACLGEQVASGGFHADNVAPSMIGGVVLIRDNATLDVHRLHLPKGLQAVVVYPHISILTKTAREILRPDLPLKTHICQNANIAAFVIAMYNSDLELIRRSLRDEVIEPQRASLIPNFYEVQAAAFDEGALGCSISGAGPSIFALCPNTLAAENAGAAMQAVFRKNKIESTVFLSAINQEGAVIL